MENFRQTFLKRLAQTSDQPMLMEITHAKGAWLFGKGEKKYLDFISGIGVSNIGHCDDDVTKAIQLQAEKYLHTMVFGEYVLQSQVEYANEIIKACGEPFEQVYFVNSGSEATEGALKLAKKFTGRSQIIAFHHSYHGSTHGALSVTGSDELKEGYGPFLPEINFLTFNSIEELRHITNETAAVIIEPIQGEAGIRVADKQFLAVLRTKCDETGTLLIFDEIQSGMGRTGALFAFKNYGVVPDILLLGKALGGGMPLGAFVSSQKIMQVLSVNPVLGHITTFGGHPVSCAAGLTAFKKIIGENLSAKALQNEQIIRELLQVPQVKEIRGKGLMLAVELNTTFDQTLEICRECWKRGLIVDWFLHCSSAIRLSPPLIISEEEIQQAMTILKMAILKVLGN